MDDKVKLFKVLKTKIILLRLAAILVEMERKKRNEAPSKVPLFPGLSVPSTLHVVLTFTFVTVRSVLISVRSEAWRLFESLV